MLYGAWIVRVPAEGWSPAGHDAAPGKDKGVLHAAAAGRPQVRVDVAWKTPQFWLLWVVLCMNVSAGIGILGQASLMCQDMFGVSAAIGGGFAGLLSIFNMGGRFVWSFFSDLIGRRAVYCVFFLLGGVLYCLVPWTQRIGSQTLFVVVTALIISMYGGGFATIPAYLRDLFGTMQVGAIHGRLITAWSMAAVIGPALVNYISEAQKKSGVPAAEAYNRTMYIVASLLVVGFAANLLVRPVDPKFHHKPKPTGEREGA
jgi:MFS family permease